MQLQKLEIQGFKSFASKTTLTFPTGSARAQSITAVVGPNGSGKSNVADAIRWVLGEQSLKLLRGKKSEDVIFFGSDKKSQLGFAEVSLFFSNTDHILPLDFEEVVITRRVYRSGDSEYLINKSKVRLSDVVLLLAQGNVGQKSYSVIGQGMIDSIINAAPAERRDFFYEAAGVRHFQIKKDQSLTKIKETESNLAQARLLMAEIEPKLSFLARQIERMDQRGGIEKELRERLVEYYSHQWHTLEENLHQQQTVLKTHATSLLALEGQLLKLEQSTNQQEQSRDTSAQDQIQELRKKINILQSRRTELAKEKAVAESKLQSSFEKSGEQAIGWLLERKTKFGDESLRLDDELREVRKDCADLEGSEKDVRDNLKEKEVRLQDLRAQLKNLEAQRPTRHNTDTISVELQRVDELLTSLTLLDDIELVHGTIKEIQEILLALRPHLTGQVLLNPHIEEINRLQDMISPLLSEIESIRKESQELGMKLGITRHRLQDLERKTNTTRSDLEKVTHEYALASSTDNSAQHKVLMERCEKLDTEIKQIGVDVSPLEREIAQYYAREKSSQQELLTLQKSLNQIQQQRAQLSQTHNAVAIECARLEAHREDLFGKICEEFAVDGAGQDSGTHYLNDVREAPQETLDIATTIASLWNTQSLPTLTLPLSQLAGEINRLKQKLERIGMIDPEIMTEYETTKERHLFLDTQIADLAEAIEKLHAAIIDLDTDIRKQFYGAVDRINDKFNHYFHQLFNGGSAKLAVIKKSEEEKAAQEDGAEEVLISTTLGDEIVGIEIQATPPGKKLKTMAVLSGGEKALTAIALICAIIANNPSPFVLLDEVDAALDDANAYRFAHIIQELSEHTQFIVITHSQVTMHAAKVLYGVTMGADGVSAIVSLDFDRAASLLDSRA